MADAQQMRLKQTVELATLCDCYGGLLTAKQLKALRLYCDEDLTLAEIADEMAVSRQNVHELITRSEQKLRRYESAQHLAAQITRTRAGLTAALAALDAGDTPAGRGIVNQLLQTLDEEEPSDGI